MDIVGLKEGSKKIVIFILSSACLVAGVLEAICLEFGSCSRSTIAFLVRDQEIKNGLISDITFQMILPPSFIFRQILKMNLLILAN